MSPSNPFESDLHGQVLGLAQRFHDHLPRQSSAYAEIWLNEGKISVGEKAEEPIYGKTTTFPRLADVICCSEPEKGDLVSEEEVKIQHDFGDRGDRRHARLKYTIENCEVKRVKQELNDRLGWSLDETCEFSFDLTTDRCGWSVDKDGRWALGLLFQGGRLLDQDGSNARQAIRRIALEINCELHLTAKQNLVIARVPREDKEKVDEILKDGGLCMPYNLLGLLLNSISCTALPTSSLAMAESERCLPDLVDELDEILGEFGLREESIAICSTGFLNGCGRPYLGEIGLVGKAPGKYNLYLGVGLDGMRLNKLYRKAITHD